MSGCNIRMSNPELFESLNLISENSKNGFYTKMVLASLISAFALAADSQEGVIGSMLVAPFGGVLLALGASVVTQSSLSHGVSGIVGGVLVMLITGYVVGTIFKDKEPTKEMKKRYTAPDRWTFVSALIIGCCFALVSIYFDLGVSAGGSIAISLAPPCVNAAMTYVNEKIPQEEKMEAVKNTAMITGVNAVGIIISSIVVYSMFCKYPNIRL